jgi:hypothetical protein
MSARPSYLKPHRLSRYDREGLAIIVFVAAVSLAGIALCWWLS